MLKNVPGLVAAQVELLFRVIDDASGKARTSRLNRSV
jgi:hypothetical protein